MSTLQLIVISVALLFGVPSANIADAEKEEPSKPSTAVLLAQMCVSEISWQKDPRECRLMMEVNNRNAKRSNRTITKQTRLFNAYFKQPNQGRKWIQYLNAEGTAPKYWPQEAASWKKHRPYWAAYLAAAKQFLKQRTHQWFAPLCLRADDYGGRCDDNGLNACDTPKQTCARKITCLHDKTKQAYWNLDCCKKKNKTKCSDVYAK